MNQTQACLSGNTTTSLTAISRQQDLFLPWQVTEWWQWWEWCSNSGGSGGAADVGWGRQSSLLPDTRTQGWKKKKPPTCVFKCKSQGHGRSHYSGNQHPVHNLWRWRHERRYTITTPETRDQKIKEKKIRTDEWREENPMCYNRHIVSSDVIVHKW